MGLSFCPAAIIAAPVELVWANLVQWDRYPEWAFVHADQIEPPGPATAGQSLRLGPKLLGYSLPLHFTFKVEAVYSERHQIEGHVVFPFGLQEKPRITCYPIDGTTCRVQYE